MPKLHPNTTNTTSGSQLTKKLKLQPSQLAVAFRHIKPTWKHYLDYVESAAREGDKEMVKVMGAFVGLTRREQASIMPEQLCDLAGVKPDILFGSVCQQLWAASKMECNIITAVMMPRVVKRTMDAAASKGGVKDREMVHKHSGFLPTPKPSQTAFFIGPNGPTALSPGQGQGQLPPAKVISLPSMEEEALAVEQAITIPLLSAGEGDGDTQEMRK